MDLTLSGEEEQLRTLARDFARNELSPLAREIERTSEPLSRSWRLRLGEMGFLGMNIAPEFGGHGLSDLAALIVLEEFAKVHPAVAFPVFESVAGPIKAIEAFGEPELKQRIIPQVCRGERVVAVAMSEPGAGTALTDLTTSGRIEADSVVLNGVKRWCSGGGHADGYLVYCRLGPEAGAKGIGAVYLDAPAAGLSFGAREELMGFRGIASADIFLDDVAVPLGHIVMPAGGFGRLMEAFDLERCGNATMCLGLAAAALEDTLVHVEERRQFGRPIADFQAVQLKIAEMAMQVEAARLLIHRAVSRSEGDFPSIADSSMAKCFANEMVRDVTGKAMQLMGGYGYSKAYPPSSASATPGAGV